MKQFIICIPVGTPAVQAIPVDRVLHMEEIFDDVDGEWDFVYTRITWRDPCSTTTTKLDVANGIQSLLDYAK